ncbi:beta-1,6-N-acetylglucosaminyltransferase [uncultured Bacteroides sp.]|uniref:beta-1,6-N-acetylglucosaminyltransferase n=1 Tax=uncultured Bacteroides sp. TaxID=162156 RepID=UPI002608C497|nr:beta-1,6-N-acetylglucosaminyltransferase [uncultured Bacteroides sp.]
MMENKHAYLIIAHNEPEVLGTLLALLDDGRNDVFLYIDKHSKALREEFGRFRMRQAGLYLLPDPIAVYWGDLSLVKVEFMLFEYARKQGSYAYYHLLSGVDLPIKSQDYIHDFFLKNQGKEFVGFWLDDAHHRDLMRKVLRYYLFTQYLKGGSPLVHGLCAVTRNFFLAVQKIIKYKRKHIYPAFQKGFQWLSITQDFCDYLLENKDSVLKTYRFTLCPDEIFVQTLLWNSPFKKNIYSLDETKEGSMRMIDWGRGNPYVWQEGDVDELLSSPYLFARKFSGRSIGAVEALKKRLLSGNG